ncbi:hypothetical protein N806_24785 [Rhodococcus sp. P27]|nr:hypothetical protein N806_24785 [Rhodococcus sp. P27]
MCLRSAVFWGVHADDAGVAGAEGSRPVVDVLQDELVNLFEVFTVEISCDGLMQDVRVGGVRSTTASFTG